MLKDLFCLVSMKIRLEERSMPKMKTKRAAAKRFKIKPSGKIKRANANKEHILTKKSRSRKNRLKKTGYVHKSNEGLVLRCLPNG